MITCMEDHGTDIQQLLCHQEVDSSEDIQFRFGYLRKQKQAAVLSSFNCKFKKEAANTCEIPDSHSQKSSFMERS